MLDGFDPAAVAEIRTRLDHVRRQGVTILFAIESGSRAWGFPSPDSDYDCRFVYVWPADAHLVLHVQRDVIEFPIEGEIDAGGWDLRKALRLALKGNAVIHEWARSLQVYEEVPGFRAGLVDLLSRIIEPHLAARHYIGLLRRHSIVGADGDVKLKKLFYAVRPALSLLFMQERDFDTLPPMDLGGLLDGVTLAPDLRQLITSLVETKKLMREMGMGPVPPLLARFLMETEQRFDTLTDQSSAINPTENRERLALAERFYRRTVLEHSAPAGVTTC
jgi:hypothetical protein